MIASMRPVALLLVLLGCQPPEQQETTSAPTPPETGKAAVSSAPVVASVQAPSAGPIVAPKLEPVPAGEERCVRRELDARGRVVTSHELLSPTERIRWSESDSTQLVRTRLGPHKEVLHEVDTLFDASGVNHRVERRFRYDTAGRALRSDIAWTDNETRKYTETFEYAGEVPPRWTLGYEAPPCPPLLAADVWVAVEESVGLSASGVKGPGRVRVTYEAMGPPLSVELQLLDGKVMSWVFYGPFGATLARFAWTDAGLSSMRCYSFGDEDDEAQVLAGAPETALSVRRDSAGVITSLEVSSGGRDPDVYTVERDTNGLVRSVITRLPAGERGVRFAYDAYGRQSERAVLDATLGPLVTKTRYGCKATPPTPPAMKRR